MADDTNAREALKPCPFCGSANASLECSDGGTVYWVECHVCQADQKPQRSAADSIAAWNLRATPADRGAPAEGARTDERELFEAHWSKPGFNVDLTRKSEFDSSGHYVNNLTDAAFSSWLARARLAAPASQAGRDALDARKPFTPTQLRRLYDNSPAECAGLTRAAFERVARLVEGAHCIDATLASSAQAGQGEQA